MAEYGALVVGLNMSQAMKVTHIKTYSDSQPVVNQVWRNYQTKEPILVKYVELVKELLSQFEKFNINQIPREENLPADPLAKLASTKFAHETKAIPVGHLLETSISKAQQVLVLTRPQRT